GDRPRRKGGIPQRHFDFVERNTSLLRGDLREIRVSAGADILRAAGNADGAIVPEVDSGFGGEARRYPGATGHSPAKCKTIAFHRADLRRAFRPAKLLGAKLKAFKQMA